METDPSTAIHHEDEHMEEKIVNEEYKTWKKNAPFLYDMFLSTALDWPTLTVQWLPDVVRHKDKPYSTHRLLIGTHTAGEAPNYLQIAHINLPHPQNPDPRQYDDERGEMGGYTDPPISDMRFNIVQKIDHPQEVNKARYMPQNADMIATMCTDGKVLVWDRKKHSSTPNGTVRPQITLKGHKREGYGLCWSPHENGKLVTGSEDGTVRLWNITNFTNEKTPIEADRVYTHHSAIVNNVEFHPVHRSIIGTVSDDRTLQILDTRGSATDRSTITATGHLDAVNALAFNPGCEYHVATGSADTTVALWDLRNLKVKLHSAEGHNDAVTSLEWNPFEESVLASSSYDRRVLFWDFSKVGDQQDDEDAQDGPPELMFMHGGHTNRVSEFSWNKNDEWVMCSAAEDNLIQIWTIANVIINMDSGSIPNEEMDQ